MAWSQTLAERVTPISDTNLYAEIPTLYRPTHELGDSLFTKGDLFGLSEQLYTLVTFHGHLAFDSTDEHMATSTYLLIQNGEITEAAVCEKRTLRTLSADPRSFGFRNDKSLLGPV